ncbi:MAG: DUF5695 domain-containing protein [Planctomycetota bacterium]|nr:DUF5695 domain-containing protein [Planctomycetota bacterium]
MTPDPIAFDRSEHGVTAIRSLLDPFGVPVTRADVPLGLYLRYRSAEGDWREIGNLDLQMHGPAEGKSVTYGLNDPDSSLRLAQTFRSVGQALDWEISLENTGADGLEIGDLAISIPAIEPDRDKEVAWNCKNGFVTHQFISGNGSFLYFTRGSGVPPFLVVTGLPGTHLEYSDSGGDTPSPRYYIHSGLAGSEEARVTWRQQHSTLQLKPKGEGGASVRYSFRLQFADSYDAMRAILFEEGLFDIRSVPGMTIPEDLTARFSLHTQARIESIYAEFPEETTITPLGESRPGHHVYEVSFRRLGENMLTICHDGCRRTYLEYFVTEPLETLIKKRSAFIVEHQQVRDPDKWWDGVYAPYDMKAGVVRTIDDPDIFTGRMVYVLTCDDPGLCKAPFIAAKNVSYPNRTEIESLEYYLEHFVWGRLQRTAEEEPYPYGVYGTPHWFINRDPERRKAYTDQNLDKEHVWRSYDYPHVIMLYFHMYEIACRYPGMMTCLDAAGYLERAYGTAKAFFNYPYRIFPDYYETYKLGLYNELIVLPLADALQREGFPDRAAWLRGEWEKKVKYFVYDDPYPYGSEYTFDRTAFESSYALAKYGATYDMLPDENLWRDAKNQKWHSHPVVRREDSRDFMERQLTACLAVRGWLEATYYQLGADPSMSYMAAMGGWGILDYAINFSDQPWGWLQLGYASYLSSWSLMNTGRQETDFGFWASGKHNDGAAGWQFMSEKFGRAWMGTEVPRGPWHYDGEIDLGFGGALRMAATMITHDPVFGWIAYGGKLKEEEDCLSVVPRDGLLQRFVAVLPDTKTPRHGVRRFKVQLDRDGFVTEQEISLQKDLSRATFSLENRTGDEHRTGILLSIPADMQLQVLRDGKSVSLEETDDWDYPWRSEIEMGEAACQIEIRLVPTA